MWVAVKPSYKIQGGVDSYDVLSLQVIFRERAVYIVALLRKMTCNLRHPMPLRHPVTVELTFEHVLQGQCCLSYAHRKLSLCSAPYLIAIKGYFRALFSKKTFKIKLFFYALNSELSLCSVYIFIIYTYTYTYVFVYIFICQHIHQGQRCLCYEHTTHNSLCSFVL